MINQLKATVLVDNRAKDDIDGEWGLSIYLEDGQNNILLDVGASSLFATNAKKLGKNIEAVDYAVLSHAHYDHSLGMDQFFMMNDKADFFLREGTAENCYHKKILFKKYIGIPKKILKKHSDRFRFVKGDYTLCEDVYLIPHHTPNLSQIGKREDMYQKTRKGWKYDDFSHEQSLVFNTVKGLVIFNSCSHGGASNIIREVSEVFPDQKVYGMIGGFHLFNKSREEVLEFAKNIKKTGVEYICTGHCTGKNAYDILKEELGDIVHQLQVGMIMEF